LISVFLEISNPKKALKKLFFGVYKIRKNVSRIGDVFGKKSWFGLKNEHFL
jgi:hypothetical protein